MTVLSTFIVDDHPVVRGGLRAVLEGDGIDVVGEAASGEDCIARIERVRPDVVLMDLHLGAGMNGAEATERLLALPHPPRVIVLTTYDSDSDILPAISAGATGYLLKDTEPADLLAAVRTGAAGETVLAPRVASRLVSRVRTPRESLTPREVEILARVADGGSNQAIGRAMHITEATVKSHLVQIFSKLGVENRTSAVAEARARGVIK